MSNLSRLLQINASLRRSHPLNRQFPGQQACASLLRLISRPVESAAKRLSCDLENGFDLHGGSERERADPDGRPRMTSVVAENLHK